MIIIGNITYWLKHEIQSQIPIEEKLNAQFVCKTLPISLLFYFYNFEIHLKMMPTRARNNTLRSKCLNICKVIRKYTTLKELQYKWLSQCSMLTQIKV